MIKKLVIFSCSYLAPEISHVLKNGDYPDIKLVTYPANCAQNVINPSSLFQALTKFDPIDTDICIMGNTCLSFNSFDSCKFSKQEIHLQQCFEIFLNREIVNHYISKGYYLVTNGWLRLYEQHIRSWGFQEGTSKQFFGESMKGILFLDTQIDGDYQVNLQKLLDYMGLPFETLPIGLTYCTNFINSLVFNWRNTLHTQRMTSKMSEMTRQSADYATIFHQLSTLVHLTDERSIIEASFDLLTILYAPKSLRFTQLIDGMKRVFVYGDESAEPEKSDKGDFIIEVSQANTVLGLFDVCGVQFPQYIEEYKKTGLVLNYLFGLAIANARRYEIIVEQKKQLETYSTELLAINNSKDKFFSILAHDLRGPLGSALGWSDALIQDVDKLPIEQISKMSQMVYQSVNTTFNLLTNLLDWARTQTGKMDFNPRPILLLEIVEEVVSLLAGQAELKSIGIKNQIPEGLELIADRNMLTTIIRNLLSNAIKYTNINGEINISYHISGRYCKISIQDNGVGLSEEKMSQLFQIENTISSPGTNREKGTGLGLVLCKEFTEKHGGEIGVKSQEALGSIFYFTIPVKESSSAETADVFRDI